MELIGKMLEKILKEFQIKHGLVESKHQNIKKEELMFHLITTDLMIISLMFL